MTQPAIRSGVVNTVCGMCYIGCGVKVQVENGTVVNIEGQADNPQNRGMMCAKGKSGIMNLYNPNRVKVPLKRTNPAKGLDVDPQWTEISWDEALDTIAAELRRRRSEPQKLWVQSWESVGDGVYWVKAFGSAFGTPYINNASSPTCGKVVHPVEFFSGGGFHQQADLHYANYCVLVGTQLGFAARGAFNHLLLDMAEARARGMKVVVVDPVGGFAGSKADEWIPIRPGTDAALALSMLHVLLNEAKLYDVPFLKHKTNAPYLVGPDGRYLRDEARKQPLVYDQADGTVKTHDDPGLKDPAITGSFQARGKTGRPAFELLREHVARYTPEQTEKFTTIPAATARRIAREFGQAARIGETITLDGVELPYRPAVVDWAKGTQGHKHGFHNCWLLKLVNIVVGAVNVPGGILSTGAAGKYPVDWFPEGGTDGMLEHGGQIIRSPHPKAFPGRTPVAPERPDIGELFPLASHFHTLMPVTIENLSAYGLKSGVEMLMHTPVNSIFGSFGDVKKVEHLFRSLRFIAGFAVELNETNLFDDIVLPFPSYLERLDFYAGMAATSIPACGEHDFHWHVRQPVVDLPPGMRQQQEILMELAARAGFLDELYKLLNNTYKLKGDHALEPGRRYAISDIVDRQARAWFGEEHDLAWFQKHGVLRHSRGVGEAYIGPFLKARIPVYLEHFLDRGQELKAVLEQMGLDWDLSDYKPIADFIPCPSYHALQKGDYDLIAVNFKLPFTYGSYAAENPWVNELCEQTESHSVLVNEAVGRAKGFVNGDTVWLESPVQKVRAKVKLTQCIHPEVVGVAGHFGHTSPGMPIARGKGVNFNGLLPTDLDHIDLISTALDHCVEVKLYK